MKSDNHKQLADFLFTIFRAIGELHDWVIVTDSLKPEVTILNQQATDVHLFLKLAEPGGDVTINLHFEECLDLDPDIDPDQYRYGITLTFQHTAVMVDRIRGLLKDRLTTTPLLASEWYLHDDFLEIVFWDDSLDNALQDALDKYTVLARVLDNALKLHTDYEEAISTVLDF